MQRIIGVVLGDASEPMTLGGYRQLVADADRVGAPNDTLVRAQTGWRGGIRSLTAMVDVLDGAPAGPATTWSGPADMEVK